MEFPFAQTLACVVEMVAAERRWRSKKDKDAMKNKGTQGLKIGSPDSAQFLGHLHHFIELLQKFICFIYSQGYKSAKKKC